jgi:REP element-mobilizing transposase RayT
VARRPRIQVEGGTYHVTAHAITGGRLYRSRADRLLFLALLERAVMDHQWACYAYCLMLNHYHLVVHTPDRNLPQGMKWLNGSYGQRFNRRHAARGHVFESRYYSGVIERETHLLEAVRYVALNPVRAGLCVDPKEWRWSSYRAWLDEVPAPSFLAVSWLLQQFGMDTSPARDRLRAFVAAGVSAGPPSHFREWGLTPVGA